MPAQTASPATEPITLAPRGRWRELLHRVRRAWRGSLQFRTVVITVALSTVAILVIGLSLIFSFASNLFQSSLDQALDASNRASVSAQRLLDSSDASDPASVQAVFQAAIERVNTTSASSAVALLRVPDQSPSLNAPTDQRSPTLEGVITPELRATVQGAKPGGSYWQSVTLPSPDGSAAPGVVVASDLTVPTAGRYELYIGYSFADAQATLSFMQLIGGIGAALLIVLLGGITFFVVRWVIDPIRTAAVTSRRIAAGDLDVRMPAKGDDELATLARSFNAMAESLQARIRELAELSAMQQRFVSDVSHELRTPLTTIRLAGDVLYGRRDEFPDTTERTVELLHTQTERFELLLSDLLEISRYDAGSVQLESEPTNLVHLAGDAIESMHALALEHGTELRLIAPGGHLDADVDPRRIRRIVRNLIGNAIEHGEGEPIVVSVDSNEDAVALSVRDHGIGMTADEAARVFDRFWRADPSRTRTIGGTGLGLAISLEDAVAHGGVLDVWSRPGEGTVFRLTLPRRRGASIEVSPLPLGPDEEPAVLPERTKR